MNDIVFVLLLLSISSIIYSIVIIWIGNKFFKITASKRDLLIYFIFPPYLIYYSIKRWQQTKNLVIIFIAFTVIYSLLLFYLDKKYGFDTTSVKEILSGLNSLQDN